VYRGAGGPLVAAYGLEFLPAVDGSDSLTVGLVSDVVVHPDYQRKGLGGWLEQAVFDHAVARGCSFLLCFPNPKLAALHAKSEAWVTEGDTRAFVRPVATPLDVGHALDAEISLEVPAGVDDLWQRLRDQGRLGQGFVRKEKFLRWRFRQHPRNRYEFLSCRAGRQLTAFAVVKVWHDPITQERSGDIVDLLAEDEAGTVSMLASACRRLSGQSVAQFTLWAPAALRDEKLHELGFAPDPLHIRPAQVRYAKRTTPCELNNWFLTQADTDIY
jgi:hypothetical protein